MLGSCYALRDVVAITGLSKQALYAWERRYSVVSPKRDDQGVRTYSESEVHRLQLLRQGVDNGQRIGKLVTLAVDELKRVVRQRDQVLDEIVAELADAVDRLDFSFIEKTLPFHFATFGPGRFTREITLPVMKEIGLRVEDGRTSVPGERFFSTMIRTFLGQALYLTTSEWSAPRILFATPGDELHDLALLSAAVSAQQLGCRAVFLGTQMPPDALTLACSKTHAPVLCLSISNLPNETAIRTCGEIRHAVPAETELWVGGRSLRDLDPGFLPGLRIYDDIDDFDDAIRRIRVSKGP